MPEGLRRQKHMPPSSFSSVEKTVVLLDANALMMPFQFSIDLEGELTRLLGVYDLVIPSSVLNEIKGLAQTDRRAKAALDLASRYPVLEVEGRGDDAIVAAAQTREAVVVTNDRGLRRRLRKAGVPVVYMRGKAKLEAEGLPIR